MDAIRDIATVTVIVLDVFFSIRDMFRHPDDYKYHEMIRIRWFLMVLVVVYCMEHW